MHQTPVHIPSVELSHTDTVDREQRDAGSSAQLDHCEVEGLTNSVVEPCVKGDHRDRGVYRDRRGDRRGEVAETEPCEKHQDKDDRRHLARRPDEALLDQIHFPSHVAQIRDFQRTLRRGETAALGRHRVEVRSARPEQRIDEVCHAPAAVGTSVLEANCLHIMGESGDIRAEVRAHLDPRAARAGEEVGLPRMEAGEGDARARADGDADVENKKNELVERDTKAAARYAATTASAAVCRRCGIDGTRRPVAVLHHAHARESAGEEEPVPHDAAVAEAARCDLLPACECGRGPTGIIGLVRRCALVVIRVPS